QIETRAPSATSAVAIARPSPFEPAATIATRPRSPRSMGGLYTRRQRRGSPTATRCTGRRARCIALVTRSPAVHTTSLRQRYLVAFIGCSIVGLLSAAEMYFWGQINDRGFGFARAFAIRGVVWLVIAPVAPAIAAWGVRFRFEWPIRGAAIAANL